MLPNSLILTALLALLPGTALAASPATIPDTPAGRALGSWLDVFNSGDLSRIDSYDKEHFPALKTDAAIGLHARTGGFDLLGIEKSATTQVIFHVRQRTGPDEDIGLLILSGSNPSVIQTLRFFPMLPGARYEEVALDAAARSRIIDAVVTLLRKSYVFSDVAKKMADALRSKEKHGAYQDLVDGEVFAVRLSGDLQDVSHDRHLELRFSPVAHPPEEATKHAEPDANHRRRMEAINCGFEKAEHLPPNIGYLKFNMFADLAVCASTGTAAMGFVADSDALIIDLRDNNGGGDMLDLIASYLFAEPTHLMDFYDRSENTTTQSWTWAYVPGKRFVGKPVFVLTSRRTFSAAEALSYALKNLKRATLIGETTGGGAHLVKPQRVDDHFTLAVPFARPISPITKTDWEGTGVEPDVKVPAADALDEALKRARSGP